MASTLLLIGVGGAIVGIIVQPTVGYVSDFTMSKWGRRKPYIVFGSLLDLVFLAGIATSNTVLALAAFVLLLAFSTNIARGPFQGYVPDLVAEPQVGLASGMVGMMQIVGNVTGFVLIVIAVNLGMMELGIAAVAVVELLTMVSVVLRVGKGMPPRPREGRSWGSIARGAWATDVLQERSFVWLLISRFLFLMGGGMLANFVLLYLSRSWRMDQVEANNWNLVMLACLLVASLVAVVPASRLSDRLGRKTLIYAACAIGGIGIGSAAFAPALSVALVGAALFGASSGIFLAVDWALMTDIIPRISSGRYMGLSNVATGASAPLSVGARWPAAGHHHQVRRIRRRSADRVPGGCAALPRGGHHPTAGGRAQAQPAGEHAGCPGGRGRLTGQSPISVTLSGSRAGAGSRPSTGWAPSRPR